MPAPMEQVMRQKPIFDFPKNGEKLAKTHVICGARGNLGSWLCSPCKLTYMVVLTFTWLKALWSQNKLCT